MLSMTGEKYWAMDEQVLRSMADQTEPLAAASQSAASQQRYQVVGDVAVLPLVGPVSKYSDLFMSLFGGTSTQDVRAQLRAALDDQQVSAILLYVDSPGGTVSGTSDLAEAIAAASKPVVAYISDMGASAAYWIASQADRIVANTTAAVGSIGVYALLADTSKLYESAGVQMKLVKAGALKGVGADGVPITDDQLSDVQREVNEIYEVFVAAVATGRGIDEAKVRGLATGQVWIASKAQQLGLIDGIDTLENVLTAMQGNDGGEMQVNPQHSGGPVAEAKAEAKAEVAGVETAAIAQPEAAAPEAKVAAPVDVEAQLKAARTEGYAEAMEHEKQRLTALIEVCGNSANFVLDQFTKGHDKGKAAIDWAKHLESELSAVRADSVGAEPVAIAVADQRTGRKQEFKDLFKVK